MYYPGRGDKVLRFIPTDYYPVLLQPLIFSWRTDCTERNVLLRMSLDIFDIKLQHLCICARYLPLSRYICKTAAEWHSLIKLATNIQIDQEKIVNAGAPFCKFCMCMHNTCIFFISARNYDVNKAEQMFRAVSIKTNSLREIQRIYMLRTHPLSLDLFCMFSSLSFPNLKRYLALIE